MSSRPEVAHQQSGRRELRMALDAVKIFGEVPGVLLPYVGGDGLLVDELVSVAYLAFVKVYKSCNFFFG